MNFLKILERQGIEVAQIELVIRPTNAYDAQAVWEIRDELAESVTLPGCEFKRADVTVFLGKDVYDSTKNYLRNPPEG